MGAGPPLTPAVPARTTGSATGRAAGAETQFRQRHAVSAKVLHIAHGPWQSRRSTTLDARLMCAESASVNAPRFPPDCSTRAAGATPDPHARHRLGAALLRAVAA